MASIVANSSGVRDTYSNSSSVSSRTRSRKKQAAEAGQFQMKVPNDKVAWVIGVIEYIEADSGARVGVQRLHGLPSTERNLNISGTEEQIEAAKQLVNEVISQAGTGGSGLVSRIFNGPAGAVAGQYQMRVPNDNVAWVVGVIENIEADSGARVGVQRLHGRPSTERTLYISGTEEQIEAAKQLVNEAISNAA